MALTASDLGMTGARNLESVDVHGPAVFRLQLLVAVATHAIGVSHALCVENLAHLVRLMAVGTCREDVSFLFPEFTLDRLAMHGLNLCVTLRTCSRDIPASDRGFRIGVGQDRVRGMARGAVRSNDQPFLEKRLAMDTLGVVLQDVVLRDVAALLYGRSFLVATAANEWDLERRDGGAWILYAIDLMVAVTIDAARRESISARHRLTMQ